MGNIDCHGGCKLRAAEKHTKSASQAVYTVIASKKLRPNFSFHVIATAHNLEAPINMKIAIEGFSDSRQHNSMEKQITLGSDETQILNFEGRDWSRDISKSKEIWRAEIGEWSYGSYELIVTVTGEKFFTERASLNYESCSVFIQTDKVMYKPGQLVQFRVLAVNPHLLPAVKEPINISITDADGNRIKQWNRVVATVGIASGELLLSDQPVLGDWEINVDIMGQIFKKSFTVAEYVLPDFEVQVSLPPYIIHSKPHCVATVTAIYTYGKKVKGSVKLTVKPSRQCDYVTNENKPAVTETEIDGSVDIPLNVVKDLCPKEDTKTLEIEVGAEVEDYLTKRKCSATNILKMYDREIKIELMRSSECVKPGLKYMTHLKVCYQDDTPISVKKEDRIILKHACNNKREWELRSIPIPNNGLLNVDFNLPVNTGKLHIGALFKGLNYHLDDIDVARSLSGSFIQILLPTENIMVDKEVELEINATEPLTHLIYAILGRGCIVLAGTIDVPNVKIYKFSIPVTYKMAPKARVMVYYVRKENHEIVADAVNFDVNGVFKTPVAVKTDVSETKPGAPVSVTVDTKANALVGLLGIDQSVLLLKSGNDITQNDVISEFDPGWKSGLATPDEIFEDSGVVVLTNGRIIIYPECDWDYFIDYSRVYTGSIFQPRVRKHFPETWIWDLAQAGNDGRMSVSKNIPDTITSWIISAFAMDPVNGLGIAPETAKVTVFRPFFVKLNLPYSVVRSESLYLEVIVFNYNKKPIKADVTLENLKEEFEFTAFGSEIISTSDEITKAVEVPAEGGVTVKFLITPKTLGYIDLKVTAISENAGDSVLKKLLVKPEGSPQFFNRPLLIDLRNPDSKEFDETVTISVPNDAVPGSLSVTLSAIGDLLGPPINNLDKLLRMPYGCGEQNMLNFVPNIVITKYLKQVNRLTAEIEEISLKFMECGYQRELTYRRNDGSFSAFGRRDKNGSTWLTAFVVRSFLQAKEFMHIDERVISTALKWLAKQQQADGSFGEPGEVYHKFMQGGSGSKNALTAYVLLAFLENQTEKTFGKYIDRATKFLSKILKSSEDPYFVSVVTYAFHLSHHSKRNQAFKKLLSFATKEEHTIYWKHMEDESSIRYISSSQDVEMTAYVLLTYSLRDDVTDSLPVLKWLTSQQNENGGYLSTQDTVVGIQSMASLASRLASKSFSIDVTYTIEGDTKKMLNIDSENAIVLQKVLLPSNTNQIKIQAVGSGICLIQVSWQYNIESTEKAPAFSLKPVLNKASTDDYMKLDICTRYTGIGASNMAVMEVGLPSGFQADSATFPSMMNLEKIKRVETQDEDTNVVIYFDWIDGEELCVSVSAFRKYIVANQKPVPIKVYDYYDLAKCANMFYEPQAVSICTLYEGQGCPDDNRLSDDSCSSRM